MAVVDGERIVSDYLRSFGLRVVGQSPSNTGIAWIRVTKVDAAQASYDPTDHLVEFLIQFDCYAGAAGGQKEAVDLGRLVRDKLIAFRGSQNGAVVTASRIVSDARDPDDQLDDPARERVVILGSIWMHHAD